MVLDSMIRAAKTRPVRRVQDMALESTKYAPNPNRGRIIGDVDGSGNIVRLAQSEPKPVTQAVQQVTQSGNGAAHSVSSTSVGSTSITGIAQAMSGPKTYAHAAGAEVTWQNCKCKVSTGNNERYLCRKFNIVCVKEKCPSKFIEV